MQLIQEEQPVEGLLLVPLWGQSVPEEEGTKQERGQQN